METARGGISLSRPSCVLYADVPSGEEPRLSVVDGEEEIAVQGACVCATLPYARARARA